MDTYISAENRDTFDQALDLRGRGDADRVREDELARLQPLAQLEDATRIDASLEGTAERDADRRGRGQLGLLENRLHLNSRLLERHVAVALVERLRRGERAVHTVETRRAQPLVALDVEDEAAVLGAVAAADFRDDVLSAGHLRHALGPDEAGRLDPRQPGRREAVD